MIEVYNTATILGILRVAPRIAGMFAVSPIFSEQAVPWQVRIFLSLVIALALAGAGQVALPVSGGELVFCLISELIVGLAIGYAASLIFAGVQIGAFHISQQMGLNLSDVFDPQADQLALVGRFFHMLAIAIFLTIGGHRELIASLMSSFDLLPAGNFPQAANALGVVVGLLTEMLVLGLKLAAPVLAAMLLATVAIGFLQKTLPQVNFLSVTIPVRSLFGLAVLAAGIVTVSPLMSQIADIAFDGITSMLREGVR